MNITKINTLMQKYRIFHIFINTLYNTFIFIKKFKLLHNKLL